MEIKYDKVSYECSGSKILSNIEFDIKSGIVFIKGQLGASTFSHSLKFEFEGDQTIIGNLIQAIEL